MFLILIRQIGVDNLLKDFIDEFEIVGGIVTNLIGLAFFCGAIIYFDQTRKAKVKRGEKTPPHQ